MLFDSFQRFRCNQISFDFAGEFWEVESYYKLRKEIFCNEQKIFEGTDLDSIDQKAMHIISTAECMGMKDEVVGVVRIYEEGPTVWWGSRLGVHPEYRSLKNLQSNHLFNNNIEVHPFAMSVGAGLIFKAVTSAKTMGCSRFYANVQYQNVNFFERLHWKSLRQEMIYGYLHHVMEADLSFYPESKFVNKLVRASA
jgi:hypothetical protein